MPQPIQFVQFLTRQVLAEELSQIETLLRLDPHVARLRLLELKLAVEMKPFDIDPQ
jgi:hypothetical protein